MAADSQSQKSLSKQVGRDAVRMLKARRQPHGLWFGFAMFGLIGWSVVVPTLLGAALGVWLDKHHSGAHSWTLALMMAGLILGCANAWHWVSKEHAALKGDSPDQGGSEHE